MIEFEVAGAFEIATTKNKGGKGIEAPNCESFREDFSNEVDCHGVYVFCISASGSLNPWYVGKATKSFSQEIFTPDKLNKYNTVLRKIEKGKPAIFFICAPRSRGKKNDSVVGSIEKKLIELCAESNPSLLNKHNNKPHRWSIKGVLRSSRGKRSAGAEKFRRMIGLD